MWGAAKADLNTKCVMTPWAGVERGHLVLTGCIEKLSAYGIKIIECYVTKLVGKHDIQV